MENMLTNLQENGKKVLTAALDFANTTAESLCSVAGQTVKSAAAKGKEFYEDNIGALIHGHHQQRPQQKFNKNFGHSGSHCKNCCTFVTEFAKMGCGSAWLTSMALLSLCTIVED